MNTLWSYFWPIFGEGLLIGAICGLIAFRRFRIGADWRRRRLISLGAGVAVVLAIAALWHGPFGAADRLTSRVERDARATLDFYEMAQVSARLHHGPLTRRLILTGPADDFQRTELVRTLEELPGVSGATWSPAGGGLPLLAEGSILAVVGFLIGLVLAYLVELRRRYNAQWTW